MMVALLLMHQQVWQNRRGISAAAVGIENLDRRVTIVMPFAAVAVATSMVMMILPTAVLLVNTATFAPFPHGRGDFTGCKGRV